MKRKVFILGCHKSGTSLLRSLLDGHKELFVIPIEAHIFENLGSWIDYYYRNQSPKILNNSGLKNNFIKRIKKANKPSSKYSAGDTSGKWDIELFKKYFHINQN